MINEAANGNLEEVKLLIKKGADDEWGILFSSGSTGVPKGIERNHNSIISELLGWCLELGLNKKTTFLS